MPLAAAFPLLINQVTKAYDKHIAACSEPSNDFGESSDKAIKDLANDLAQAFYDYILQGNVQAVITTLPGILPVLGDKRKLRLPLVGTTATPGIGAGYGMIFDSDGLSTVLGVAYAALPWVDPPGAVLENLAKALEDALLKKRDDGAKDGADPDAIINAFAWSVAEALHDLGGKIYVAVPFIMGPQLTGPIMTPTGPSTPALFPIEPGVAISFKQGLIPTGLIGLKLKLPALQLAIVAAYQAELKAGSADGADWSAVDQALGMQIATAAHTFFVGTLVHLDSFHFGSIAIPLPPPLVLLPPPPRPCAPWPMMMPYGNFFIGPKSDSGTGIGMTI